MMHTKSMRIFILVLGAALCFFGSTIAGFAQDEGDDAAFDDILNEFDDSSSQSYGSKPVDGTNTDVPDKPSMLSLKGHVKSGTAYNFSHDPPEGGETDWRGFSSLYGELKIEIKAKFSPSWRAKLEGKSSYDLVYQLDDRDEYTDDVLDNYEKEVEILEAYIQGSLSNNIDLKAGRQIVVWGKSDIIRVTDLLNPVDNQQLGLTEVEDLRLPVAMVKLDYYFGDWGLTGIAIPEIRFNKNPEYGSDFYPGDSPMPHENTPSDCGSYTEYAVALNGIFSGWDISFYVADIYEDMPHVKLISMDLAQQAAVAEAEHASLLVCGTAFNVALGNLLFKTEAAYLDGIQFLNYPKYDPLNPFNPAMTKSDEYTRTDLLVGFEYTGITNTTIGIELVNRHINDYVERREAFLTDFTYFISLLPNPEEFGNILAMFPDEAKEDEFQSAVIVTRTFLNDTLTLSFILSAFDGLGQGGSFERFTAEYDVNDNLIISGGVALYQSGDYPNLGHISDNDRLFLDVEYNF